MDENSIFTIMPMAQNIELEAGQVYEGSITVVNPVDSTTDFPYDVTVMPYGVSEDGTATDLISDSERTAISKWIRIPEPKGVLHPNEKKEIKFTIEVPYGVAPGGQYATIAVASSPEANTSDKSEIQNVYEMASIIYATVSGEINHDSRVTENNIPSFTLTTPILVSSTIENNGNIHEEAYIDISVSNFFTGETIIPSDINDGHYTEMIMPESTSNTERELSNLPPLGAIIVKQEIYLNGQISTAEKTVIICPIWFIIAVLLVLTAICFTTIRLIKNHRRKAPTVL